MLDIQSGDIALIKRGGIGVIVDIVPISTMDSTDDEWQTLSRQKEYWKTVYKIDIGNPTHILNIVHIPAGTKIYKYPDTTVVIVKNKLTRRYLKKWDYEMNAQIAINKREARKYKCVVCNKKIHWWQRIKIEYDPLSGYFVTHSNHDE